MGKQADNFQGGIGIAQPVGDDAGDVRLVLGRANHDANRVRSQGWHTVWFGTVSGSAASFGAAARVATRTYCIPR